MTIEAGQRRVLILAEWYFPHVGGSEQVGHGAALALTRAGYDVTVYTPQYPDASDFDLQQPYRIMRSDLWARLRSLEGGGSRNINRCARLLAAQLIFVTCLFQSWDYLLCIHLPILAVPGRLLCAFGRRKIVAWALGEELAMGRKSAAMRAQLRLALRASRVVVTISQDTAEMIGELGVKPHCMVMQYPTPADSFFLPLNPERARAARERYASKDTLLFVTISRLVERKGIDTTLRALATLRERMQRPFIYVIAGTGPYRDRLEALAAELKLQDVVKFTGNCSEAEKLSLIEAADLFLTPNRELPSGEKEGFGIVFVEAALRGTPSIGGRSGGTADAIAEGVSGWLVDASTPDELTILLSRLSANGDDLSSKRTSAREWAASHFAPHHKHLPLIEALEKMQ